MNQSYRLVWSPLHHALTVAAEHTRGRGKQGRALGAVLLTATIGMPIAAPAAELPTGGRVVAGQASISQSGSTMTITQGSQRMAADWQSFSIGQGHTVQFVQPSSSAAALNRVTGTDVSVIQGALRANGQVFLINPHGVLFTPTAQVNVGGLVASTLNVSNDDFMAGRLRFAGDSTNAVINQGNIVAGNGGTVAMIAARIVNTGSITAPEGNVLMGAGSRVTLDLGGPVKIEVTQGAIDALVEQGGAIHADGGLVYLTAKAANALTTTVINHTGVTEAKTLASGKEGRIFLMGDMENDRIAVGGRLDASAPSGGDGGFIETSAAKVSIDDAARVSTLAASGRHGTWLIDPEDFTISGTGAQTSTGIGADTLGTNLGSGNVTLATSGAGGGNGDIFVNAPVTWNANTTLTLSAHRDIRINADITANGATGGLALEYGQVAGATNNTSDYYLGSGVKVHLQPGTNFSTKLGFDGATVPYQVITTLGPEVISNNDNLQGINLARNGAYAMGADIDASPAATWNTGFGFAPLGGGVTPFTGQFAGLGHRIGGLTITRAGTDNVGLFGVVSGNGTTVRDVHVGAQGGTPSSVTGRNGVGGLAATLENGARILGSSFDGAVTGRFEVGGLVGQVIDSGSRVTRSTSAGTVAVSLQDSDNQTGGLVGINWGGISASSSSATVNSAGKVGGLVGRNYGSISDSSASGAVTGVDALAGGLVGHNARLLIAPFTTGSIERSHATGAVSANAGDIGGLVGMNSGTVNTAHATGAVTIAGEGSAGGLVGRNDGANSVISVTYATGSVSVNGTDGLIGGLAGWNDGQIATSFATGTVTGGSSGTTAAGLVAMNIGGATISNTYATGNVVNANGSGAAGLVYLNGGTITNSYATGAVSNASIAGGLIGLSFGTVTNSYWDTERSGQATSAGGGGVVGKTTAEMKQLGTFIAGNWNITNQGRTAAIWRIYEGYTTPWLIPHFAANVDVQPVVTSKVVDGNTVMQGSFTLSDYGVIQLTSASPAVAPLNNAFVRGTHAYTAASPEVGTHAATMTGLWSNQLEYNLHVLPATGTILPVPSTPPADPSPVQPDPSPVAPVNPPASPVDPRTGGAIGEATNPPVIVAPPSSGFVLSGSAAPLGTSVREMAINSLELINVNIVNGSAAGGTGASNPQSGGAATPGGGEVLGGSAFTETGSTPREGSGPATHDDTLPAHAGTNAIVEGNPLGVVRVFSINGGLRLD